MRLSTKGFQRRGLQFPLLILIGPLECPSLYILTLSPLSSPITPVNQTQKKLYQAIPEAKPIKLLLLHQMF